MKIYNLLLLLWVTVFSGSLFAQVMVVPQEIVFKENERTKSVTLINTGKEKKTYRISLVHYKQLESGKLKEVEEPAEGEFFADKVIRFGPRRVTLYPQSQANPEENKYSSQIIRVRKRFKSSSPDGEYRSHMMFVPIDDERARQAKQEKNPQGIKIELKALIGVSIPVILRKGNLKSYARLDNIRVTKNDKGEPFLNFDILRKGTRSLRGNIFVYSDKKLIGLLRGLAAYLSIEKRNVSVSLMEDVKTWQPMLLKKILGKNIRIEFREKDKSGGKLLASANYQVPRKLK